MMSAAAAAGGDVGDSTNTVKRQRQRCAPQKHFTWLDAKYVAHMGANAMQNLGMGTGRSTECACEQTSRNKGVFSLSIAVRLVTSIRHHRE